MQHMASGNLSKYSTAELIELNQALQSELQRRNADPNADHVASVFPCDERD